MAALQKIAPRRLGFPYNTLCALAGGTVYFFVFSALKPEFQKYGPMLAGISGVASGATWWLLRTIFVLRQDISDLSQPKSSSNRSTEDRLDELERLKRRDMVTQEEYAAKRQEILKDL